MYLFYWLIKRTWLVSLCLYSSSSTTPKLKQRHSFTFPPLFNFLFILLCSSSQVYSKIMKWEILQFFFFYIHALLYFFCSSSRYFFYNKNVKQKVILNWSRVYILCIISLCLYLVISYLPNFLIWSSPPVLPYKMVQTVKMDIEPKRLFFLLSHFKSSSVCLVG